MAQKVTVLLVDDIDGDEADETVHFALDGVTYEIDLKSKNAEGLRSAIEKYRLAARRVRGKATTSSRPSSAYTALDRKAMQVYAEKNGLPVPSDRGRISHEVSSKWEAAGRPR